MEQFFHQGLKFSFGWGRRNMSLVSRRRQLICQVLLVQQNGISNIQLPRKPRLFRNLFQESKRPKGKINLGAVCVLGYIDETTIAKLIADWVPVDN